MSYKVCSACCNSCFDSIRWSAWHLLMQFQTWYGAGYTPSIRARSCTFNNIGKIIGALSVLPLPVFSWCYCFVPNATFCSTHLNHAHRLSYQHTWTVAVYGKPCHPLVMCVCRWMRGGHSQQSFYHTHTPLLLLHCFHSVTLRRPISSRTLNTHAVDQWRGLLGRCLWLELQCLHVSQTSFCAGPCVSAV